MIDSGVIVGEGRGVGVGVGEGVGRGVEVAAGVSVGKTSSFGASSLEQAVKAKKIRKMTGINLLDEPNIISA